MSVVCAYDNLFTIFYENLFFLSVVWWFVEIESKRKIVPNEQLMNRNQKLIHNLSAFLYGRITEKKYGKKLFTLSPCPEWLMFKCCVLVHWHHQIHFVFQNHKNSIPQSSCGSGDYKFDVKRIERKKCLRRLNEPAAKAILNAQHWFPNCTIVYFHSETIDSRKNRIRQQRERERANERELLNATEQQHGTRYALVRIFEITVRIPNSCKTMLYNEGKKTRSLSSWIHAKNGTQRESGEKRNVA